MIEIIYNETSQGSTQEKGKISLPNNIRQIGESRPNLKIYLEDYAYTFLKRLSGSSPETGRAAVLLGEIKWDDPASYIFVKSALEVECDELAPEHVDFKEAQWEQVHRDMEKYFPEQKIIGWSLSLPGYDMEITDVILKTHLNHFAGNQKILFVMEPTEKEEAFFVYDNGRLKRQGGFYIYYEKNEPMQAYMIEKNGNASIENKENVTDRAVLDFRKLVEGKKEGNRKRKGNGSYITGVCAAAALLVAGFTFFNHWSGQEQTTEQVSQNDLAAENLPGEGTTDELPAVTDEVQDESKEVQTEEKDSSAVMPQEEEETKEQETQQETQEDEGAEEEETETEEMPSLGTENDEEQAETSAGSYERYVVKRGDTLTKISETYYGGIQAVQEICEINNLTSEDLIYAGQIILLP